MTIRPLQKVSAGQNGVGAFILQCKRLEFHYCDWAGSSKGMNQFIRQHLPTFAAKNPQIEITVSPRPQKHPVVVGHFINGNNRPVCVRNLDANQILKKVELLREMNGEVNKKFSKPVRSINESVRGVWSPYHGNGMPV
ncbi:hypothetical protein PpBr36_00585 [Pyricularia pennisetigena]|uniref:hypothetical protein n=1 Tax=Pyricularia pennisetigena TaxID=1578925 RepID=UPI001152761C|nr:hypothetical protein PpBr36_00585 [Pyricularia pennisetigena]TLS28721.1 hypothetical protein PpBr36_00585 [Pyricularia pennisetigena]